MKPVTQGQLLDLWQSGGGWGLLNWGEERRGLMTLDGARGVVDPVEGDE